MQDPNVPDNSPSHVFTKRQYIILTVILFILIFGGIFLFFSMQAKPLEISLSQNEKNNAPISLEQKKRIPPYALIYGEWSNNTSVISSYNLKSQTVSTIALLPFAIKHVSALSPDELLYIDATNDLDQGTKLSVKNISQNTTKTLLSADPGFRIDNYMLSQNKKYLSVWEVSFLLNATSVLGGKSRVYAIDVSHPIQKYLLYDEASQLNNPVHYPVAITNSGEVILDTFVPNTGAGWGYGWSISNLTGEKKGIIADLQNGTMSTRPIQSPSGSLLLFAGYDGSTGSGTEYKGAFRKALISPNVLEVFNTDTNTLKRIDLPNTDRYTPVSWEINSLGFVYKIVSPDTQKNGVYYYDLTRQETTKIILDTPSPTYNPTILSVFSKNNFLLGNQNNNSVNLSNLGNTYRMSLNAVSLVQNGETIESETMSSSQFIDVVKESYFKPSAKVASQPTVTPKIIITAAPGGKTNNSNKQLQLEAFVYKPGLEDLPNQQTPTGCTVAEPGNDFLSDPKCNRCVSVAAQTCNDMLGTNFPASYWVDMPIVDPHIKPLKGVPTIDPKQITGKYKAFLQCYFQTYIDITVMLCNDSPLYLYGEKGTRVQIHAGVPVDNSNAPYNPIDGYITTLDTDGQFFIQNKLYNKISFDYVPGIRTVERPKSGIIIKKEEIGRKMTWYGKQLGLNNSEIKDIIGAITQKTTKPYILVSHFSEDISKEILPLSFTPQPEHYYNIVFYSQGLDTEPQFSLPLPAFENTSNRNGLTAVEISYISQ